jgi:hypothetical protein
VNAKFWIALIVAAALFLLGTALVMSDPLFRAFIEKFQTLLAALLAILAAGIAYCGAVTAARIQSKAVLDQAHAQAATQTARDQARRNLDRQNFRNAVLAATHHLRSDLLANRAFITEMIKTQGAVTRDSLHVLRAAVHPILLSDWKELTLLDPLMMEQIIALQQFISGINNAVTRLELQHGSDFPKELIDDLDEYYDGAIKFISTFVPHRAASTTVRKSSPPTASG